MKFQCRSCALLVAVFALSLGASSANERVRSQHLHVEERKEDPAPLTAEQEALLKKQPPVPTEVENEDIWLEKRLGLDYATPDGETPVDVHVRAVLGKRKEERLPVSVETMLAILFIAMIACVPFILAAFEGAIVTKTQKFQSAALLVWLFSGVYIFTNVIQFTSGHFRPDEVRSLTLVEYIYLIAQIMTTVGYGDITPAFGRGQVFIGIYVFVSLLLIADMVSSMATVMLERTRKFARKMAHHFLTRAEGLTKAAGEQQNEGGEESVDPKPVVVNQDLAWLQEEQPQVPFGALIGTTILFICINLVGICFYHLYPGEEKTWAQAIYMSVITLSTVGFGAMTADTEMGKAFGAFWMLFGVAALGACVSAFATVVLQLKEREKWHPKQSLETFKELSLSMGLSASKGDVEKPSKRLDDFDFLKFALVHSKSLSSEDVDRIEKSFYWLKPTNGKVKVTSTRDVWCK